MKKGLLLFVLLAAIAIIFQACKKEGGTPTTLEYVSGNNQSDTVLKTLSAPLVVRVLDEAGNPVKGDTVLFEVLDGGGALSNSVAISDNNGLISSYWTLGETSGTQQVVARAGFDGGLFVFLATALGPFFTDSRDGEIYKTIRIGDQTWMAENLRYDALGSWLNPDNPTVKYGRLYDWATVMDLPLSYNTTYWAGEDFGHQGICPEGWRIPTDDDWNTLELAIGMNPVYMTMLGGRGSHGLAMKSTTGWDNNGNGTNESGFNVLPAGRYWASNGDFNHLGNITIFWSSTKDDIYGASKAWGRGLDANTKQVYRSNDGKFKGYSCRCIQD